MLLISSQTEQLRLRAEGMTDITVIGLGLMGSALARAINRAGHGLTVWNRSSDKMQPFIDNGIAGAVYRIGVIIIGEFPQYGIFSRSFVSKLRVRIGDVEGKITLPASTQTTNQSGHPLLGR